MTDVTFSERPMDEPRALEGERVIELISAQQIQTRIAELGKQITEDYRGGKLIVVGVLKGSFPFMSDLIRAIELPLACDFLGISSYGDATATSGVARITSDLSHPIQGEDLLVVEDIVDTGLTMSYLLKILGDRHPRSVKVCSLLHKPARIQKPVNIDYLGFTIPDRFVAGYGLDWQQVYRNLPYIGVVEPKK